jgi:hypothetical protein
MTVSRDNLVRLASARRDAKIRVVIDSELIKNDSEANLLTALIKAYGDSPAGFIYYSPGRARSTERPPDAVVCHPEIGILVIDAKGHTIDQIENVEAGHIFVRYKGRIEPKNVIQQVENQMFEIRSDAIKLVRDQHKIPLTNAMIAFPNIRESEWVACGYDNKHPMVSLIFKDQLETRARLKQRIGQLVHVTLKESGKTRPLDLEQAETIYKVFGNSSVINDKRPPRANIDEATIGSYVDEIMALDKYLSREQEDLSRMMFEESPRLIRGVAGSGKSVVLANIVARYLHRHLSSLEIPLFPEQGVSIAVTCYNRALVEFLKQKIRLAYKEQTLTEDIPSKVLTVVHLNSFMYSLRQNGWHIDYIPVSELKVLGSEEVAKRYREQIRQFAATSPEQYKACCFDAIFIDEGQDFEPEEYRLILDLIRPNEITDEKPIVIFYDDAQNVYGKSRPVWDDVGLNVIGARSFVMRECFRNTREIVELAFNILLGSQAEADRRVQTRTYADINYLKERGVIEETGDHIRVKFAERTYQRAKINPFVNQAEEVDWLVGEITRLIQEECVRPEDILVVFDRTTHFDYKKLESAMKRNIPELEFIKPFGDSPDKDRFIFQPGKLTLSTVFGAKGYDAPIVFLVGVDTFGTDKEGRAAFYVGATRAKLLLYLSGVTGKGSLLDEAKAVNQMI